MKDYSTLSEAMADLRKEGYTADLSTKGDHLVSDTHEQKLFANDFEVDHVFRFEGQSNPADMSILYAVSSDRYDIKGLLVNAFGVYSEDVKDELAQKFQ